MEAVKGIADGVTNGVSDLPLEPFAIAVLGSTIVLKAILYTLCSMISKRTGSGTVSAYAQDHRNDVCTNFMAVVAVLIAHFLPVVWWLDPAGGILIASWTMFSWLQTGKEHMGMLICKTAPPDVLRQLTYVAYKHDLRIEEIDTVRAYHFGMKFLVEIDVVLPPDMCLREAHDIGESLQIKVERLNMVERAFVHLDNEADHSPNREHRF